MYSERANIQDASLTSIQEIENYLHQISLNDFALQ